MGPWALAWILGCDRDRDVDVDALGTGELRLRLTGALTLDAVWTGLGPDGLAAFTGAPMLDLPWPTPGRAYLWRDGAPGRTPGPWRVSGCAGDAGFRWAGPERSSGWLCVDADDEGLGMSIGLYEAYEGDTGWTLHVEHPKAPIGPSGALHERGQVLKNGTTPAGEVDVVLEWTFDPASARHWTYRYHPRRAL